MARFQEVIEQVPAVAALRRRLDDGRRALLRDRRVAQGDGRLQAHPRRRRDQRPRDVQDRVVRVEARRPDPGRQGLQARARQGGRGRAHRHRGAAPAQRLAARRGARVPGRRVHRGSLDLARRRSSTSSPRSAASSTRATSWSRSPRATARRPSGSARTTPTGSSIKMDPESIKAADYQRNIIANWNSALDVDSAQEEIKVLLDNYGPEQRVGEGADATARRSPARSRPPRSWSRVDRDQHPRRGAAPREGLKRPSRSNARRADLPPTSHAVHARADAYDAYLTAFGDRQDAPPRSRPRSATTAPTSCASSSARSRTPATSTSRSARPRRSASTTRTRCSTR